MSHVITGLDIGSSHIKGLVVEVSKSGKLSVITAFHHPSAGIKRGIFVDADEGVTVLRDIARDLEKVSKSALRNVFVNVNSEHIKARTSRGIVAVARSDQEIQQEDLDRVIQASRAVKLLPNHVVLHNITREYFVDDIGEILDPSGMTGNRLEVSTLIVEAFLPQVNFLTKHVERAGFTVGGLIFNPLAAGRAVLSKRQRDLGVVLIDFGADTTSFVLYEDNKVLHTKSFPVGSNYVTRDIATGLRVPIDVAEQLKIEHGSAFSRDVNRRDVIRLSELDPDNDGEVSKRFLTEIIEVRLAEILELVVNELKGFGRQLQLPGGAVIVGGGVKLPGMTELVRHTVKLPVQIGIPDSSHFEVQNPAYQNLLEDPEFAVAAGLALWGSTSEGRNSSTDPKELIRNIFRNLMP